MTQFDYSFNFIVVGEASIFIIITIIFIGVGKTCLLLQFTENKFQENYSITIGVDFGTRTVEINGKMIKTMIWDSVFLYSFNINRLVLSLLDQY